MDKRACGDADLMSQAADLMQDLARDAHVSLSITPLSQRIHADPDRIVQTLTNLLANAIKFSPKGGTIWLEAEPLSDRMVFLVRDQGRGIPNDMLESIFGKLLLVVYTARDLDADEREKLRLGETYFFTKSRITHTDFERSVVGLLQRIVPNEQESDHSYSQTDSSHR